MMVRSLRQYLTNKSGGPAALAVLLSLSACPPAAAVGTSTWTHTDEAEWREGTFDNVVATSLGDLKLSRAVRTLLEQNPRVSSVNALAQAPDGTIYAGTGPRGVLLRVKGEAVEQAAKVEDPNIFAVLVEPDGAVLLGTGGERGRVLRVPKDGGEPREVFRADGVQYVWAIRRTDDGSLYVATGPTGQVHEVKPDGTRRVLIDTDENNVLSLATDGGDLFYAGTDPNGLVYRIHRKTGEAFILYDAAETEISALALDTRGNLYAGTAEAQETPAAAVQASGGAEQVGRPEAGTGTVPLPSERPEDPKPPVVPDPNPGQPKPIPKHVGSFDREDGDARAAASSSAVAQVTRPVVPVALQGVDGKPAPAPEQPAPGGDPTPSPQPPPQPGPGPTPTPDPGKPKPAPQIPTETNLPGRQPPVDTRGTGQPRADGNAVYRIDPGGFVTEVFRQPVLVLSIVEREGTLLIATGSGAEGQVYQVNPSAEETIVLAKVNPKQILALLPTRDGRVYMGLANVGGVAVLSSGFAAEGSYTSPVLDAQQVSRFGNLQLHGSLPGGSTLRVSTRSGNVRDSGQKSWSAWSQDVPAAEFVKVQSPPARFLQYRLTFVAGEKGNESPVAEDVAVSYQMPNLPPLVKSVRITPAADPAPPGTAEVEPARIPTARRQVIAWEASDANADSVLYSLYFRRGPSAPWILMKDKVRETSFEWDTRSVADGRYEVKVVASDAPSNPPGTGRTASRVSDPVLIDNTPPAIGDLVWRQKGQAVQVELTAVDRTGVVAAMEYAVSSGREWQSVLPSDNIFDGPEERVTFSIPGLPAGTHQVTVRATDARGNQAFENVFVETEAPAAQR